MNCKPGDLAIRVNAPNGAFLKIGTIVCCLEMNKGPVRFPNSGRIFEYGTVWDVEVNGRRTGSSGFEWAVPDCDLRPIRDNDGEDETLHWAPVPVKEIA